MWVFDVGGNAVQHCLESAGPSLDKVVMVRVYAANAAFYGATPRMA
jgi:hypothetical protein